MSRRSLMKLFDLAPLAPVAAAMPALSVFPMGIPDVSMIAELQPLPQAQVIEVTPSKYFAVTVKRIAQRNLKFSKSLREIAAEVGSPSERGDETHYWGA